MLRAFCAHPDLVADLVPRLAKLVSESRRVPTVLTATNHAVRLVSDRERRGAAANRRGPGRVRHARATDVGEGGQGVHADGGIGEGGEPVEAARADDVEEESR